MKNVYLDNSATTEMSPSVIRAMTNALGNYGNPSSLHSIGHNAKKMIEQARESVAKLVGADVDEIIFTSGGTESNNTVINIAGEIINNNEIKKEIIISAIEHPSVIEAAKRLEKNGIKVSYLSVDRGGRVIIDELRKMLSEKTALVSVMFANNETGTIQDIKEICRLAHEAGALMHTDAVQAIGKVDFDVKDLDVDYASFSAHKINGPKGVGALYVKKQSLYSPFMVGGHQEAGRRAGTYNTLGIVGFGQAAKDALGAPKKYQEIINPIKNDLRELILKSIPRVIVNGDQESTLPNILNVSFPGAEGESILLYLDNYGISSSTGSACASGDTKPSHVLMAMLDDPELAHGSIRFSFGLDNTTDDVDYVMQYLPKIVEDLRSISTLETGDK